MSRDSKQIVCQINPLRFCRRQLTKHAMVVGGIWPLEIVALGEMFQVFSKLEVGEAKFGVQPPEDAQSGGVISTSVSAEGLAKGSDNERSEVDVDQITKLIAEI